MPKINWIIDIEEDLMDPQDGQGDAICYWWEDIRRREVRELIKEAYTRGYNYAYHEQQKRIDQLQRQLDLLGGDE